MIKVTVDTAEFARALKVFEAKTGKSVFDGFKDLAASAARELAVRCKPFGITSKARKVSEGAVERDVAKAYASHGRTYNELKKINIKKAYAYAAAVNKQDYVAAEKIVRRALSDWTDLTTSSDGGAHLERLRGSDGRVESAERIGFTNHTEYGEILDKKVPTAGLAKGAWLDCARELGSKGRIAAWLRKGGSLGKTSASQRGDKTTVEITNNADYASRAIRSTDVVRAINNAKRKELKRMQIIIDKIANKV